MYNLGPSYSVKFSSDAKYLSVVAKMVSVFDTNTFKICLTVKNLKDPSYAVLSADGSLLLIKNTSGKELLLKTKDGDVLHTIGYKSEGCAPFFSDCGSYIIDGFWNGDVLVRNISSGKVDWSLSFPGEMIEGVFLLKKKSKLLIIHTLCAAEESGDIPSTGLTFCNYPPVKKHLIRKMKLNLSLPSSFCPNPAEDLLAVVYGASQGRLAIVNLEDGSVLRDVSITIGGCGAALAWSKKGMIASVQKDRVVIYDADSLKEISGIELPYASDVSWAPEGDSIALGSWKNGQLLHIHEITGLKNTRSKSSHSNS